SLYRCECGHQQYRQLRMTLADQALQRMTIHTRHIHIAYHQLEGLLLQRQQRRFGAFHRTIGITAKFQGIAQGLAQSRIVFDQQNPDLHACSLDAPIASSGNTSRAQVPRPGLERKRSSPEWARATELTTARPSPVPVALVVKKGSPSRLRVAASIPEPLSLMQICKAAPRE